MVEISNIEEGMFNAQGNRIFNNEHGMTNIQV